MGWASRTRERVVIGTPRGGSITGPYHDSVLALGLYPFVVGGIIKITLAAVVLPSVWKFVRR